MLISVSGCSSLSIFFSFPSLTFSALRPPSIAFNYKMSTPGWPCWSACKDALRLVLSFSSLLFVFLTLRPLSIAFNCCTSTPDCLCWPASLDAPRLAPSFSSLLFAQTALRLSSIALRYGRPYLSFPIPSPFPYL
jgi:hypothetical protein